MPVTMVCNTTTHVVELIGPSCILGFANGSHPHWQSLGGGQPLPLHSGPVEAAQERLRFLALGDHIAYW